MTEFTSPHSDLPQVAQDLLSYIRSAMSELPPVFSPAANGDSLITAPHSVQMGLPWVWCTNNGAGALSHRVNRLRIGVDLALSGELACAANLGQHTRRIAEIGLGHLHFLVGQLTPEQLETLAQSEPLQLPDESGAEQARLEEAARVMGLTLQHFVAKVMGRTLH